MDVPFKDMKRADMLKYGALLVLVMQNSTLALTMRYSRSRGDVMYISSTAVVMSEIVKLVAASCLISIEEGSIGGLWSKLYHEVVLMPADFAKLLIPACLYTLQNNLAYIAVSNLDAASYQVLYQLKILTTALFSVVLLRRHLDLSKWLSLIVLVGGVSLVQVSGLKTGGAASEADAATGNMTIGLVSVILACCSSGFAGVYFEKVLKGSEVSVWVRNVELALIGIIVGTVGVWYTDSAMVNEHGYFYGYTPIVWAVIALQALGGIVVALVVKHADSVLKGFSTAISIVVSCLVSYMFFGEVQLSPVFVMGVSLVIISTLMYSTKPVDLCCSSTGWIMSSSSLGSNCSGRGIVKGGAGRGGLPSLFGGGSGGRKEYVGHHERIPLTEVLDGGNDDDSYSHGISSGEDEHIAEGAAGVGGVRGGIGGALCQPVRRSLPV